MKSATSLTPPSTDLSGPQFSILIQTFLYGFNLPTLAYCILFLELITDRQKSHQNALCLFVDLFQHIINKLNKIRRQIVAPASLSESNPFRPVSKQLVLK